MRNNKLHTPEGVKDYLPNENSVKIELERRIEKIFKEASYESVKTPTFEYVEVFEGKGSFDTKQMYKFLDRDGSVLSLRCDMTPAIARVAATSYEVSEIPLRFSYFENAYRYNENYQGKLREFTQAGIELIGVNSTDADGEVISIAINSLLACGIDNFEIYIGHVEFFNGIIEEVSDDEVLRKSIQEAIVKKDYIELENMVRSLNIKSGLKEILIDMPLLIGKKDILVKVAALTESKKAKQAIEKLLDLYSLISDYGLSDYISFDLGMVSGLDYYTGIIFKAYTHKTGFSVLDGGRYDNLINKFGANFPSVGFAMKMNDLISALENQNKIPSVEKTETLVMYTAGGRKIAFETMNELRNQGVSIENNLFGDDVNKTICYAKTN